MCSLTVSTLDFPAVDPRSNPDSGKILMSENLRLYTTSPVVMCLYSIFTLSPEVSRFKSTNNKFQLYHTDIHVQVLIAFNH